ncbi:DUF1641 domain-containing protein [Ferroplasma sp.]|uniref:DUF1641 domain-containing protein n=1 Tax=Ferroplasma sp. TaxID=2591003 RepID=UPI00307CE523
MENKENKDLNMEFLQKAMENNSDVIMAFMKILDKLKGAGIVNALDYINDNVIPDNLDFFARAFTSNDSKETIAKSGNTMFSLLYMLSNREMADMIKAISFNSQGIAENMKEGSKAQPLSVLKLMGILKDPEVASGLNAVIYGLKALGNILKKLE